MLDFEFCVHPAFQQGCQAQKRRYHPSSGSSNPVSRAPEVLISPAGTPNVEEHLAFEPFFISSPTKSMNITIFISILCMCACVFTCS